MEAAMAAIEDNWEIDNHGMAIEICDMPLIGILHMAEEYLLQVYAAFLLSLCLLGESGNGDKSHQHYE
jgi:hypothetical protein